MANQQKETTVIVGGGHAAGALLTTLLQKKYQHEVVLVGEEPHPPYQRPPLSKNYLAGEVDQESLYLKPRSVYVPNKLIGTTRPSVCRTRAH